MKNAACRGMSGEHAGCTTENGNSHDGCKALLAKNYLTT